MTTLVLENPKSNIIDIQGDTWSERAMSASKLQKIQFEKGSSQYSNLELARNRAAFTRWKTIENLDKYLIEFESNFINKFTDF